MVILDSIAACAAEFVRDGGIVLRFRRVFAQEYGVHSKELLRPKLQK